MELLKKVVGAAKEYGASALAVASGAMLTASSTGITVDTADVTNVSNANGYFLSSSFEVTKFLPTLAVLAAGMYVLNKVFSFVPKYAG